MGMWFSSGVPCPSMRSSDPLAPQKEVEKMLTFSSGLSKMRA